MRVSYIMCPCWFLTCGIGSSYARVYAGVLDVLEMKCVLQRRVGRVQRIGRLERVKRVGGGSELKQQLFSDP